VKIYTYQFTDGGIYVGNAITVGEVLVSPLKIGGVISQLYIIPLANENRITKNL
jgi:hypothetical protein